MLVVGKLINASCKAVKATIEVQDAETIWKMAGDQAEAGADSIDFNADLFVGR